MNEQMKAVGRQAGLVFIEDGVYGQRWYSSKCGLDAAEYEKLVELIVRECMNIVSNQTTLDTNEDFREGFNHGLKYAWTDIRKHFGVEE